MFVFQYGDFEFFTPFNQYHESLYLIGYELMRQGIMAVVVGLIIARLLDGALASRGLYSVTEIHEKFAWPVKYFLLRPRYFSFNQYLP